MNAIFALEKYRARGCIVHYIKPLWLMQEEETLKTELVNTFAENRAARHGKSNSARFSTQKAMWYRFDCGRLCFRHFVLVSGDFCSKAPLTEGTLEEWKEQLLSNYRVKRTYRRKSEVMGTSGMKRKALKRSAKASPLRRMRF